MPPLIPNRGLRQVQAALVNPQKQVRQVAKQQQGGQSGTIPGTSTSPLQVAMTTGAIQPYPAAPSPSGNQWAGVGQQVLNNSGNPAVVMGNLKGTHGGNLPADFQDGGFAFIDALGNGVAGYDQTNGLWGFGGGGGGGGGAPMLGVINADGPNGTGPVTTDGWNTIGTWFDEPDYSEAGMVVNPYSFTLPAGIYMCNLYVQLAWSTSSALFAGVGFQAPTGGHPRFDNSNTQGQIMARPATDPGSDKWQLNGSFFFVAQGDGDGVAQLYIHGGSAAINYCSIDLLYLGALPV